MPQSVLGIRVAAVLDIQQTFDFELGHVSLYFHCIAACSGRKPHLSDQMQAEGLLCLSDVSFTALQLALDASHIFQIISRLLV